MNALQRFPKISLIGLQIILLPALLLFGERQPQANSSLPQGAISIVVSPYGFTQERFSLPAGPYTFVVVNRTGFDDISVYLERMPGKSVADIPKQQEFGDVVGLSRARLVRNADLKTGTYRLRVANRPTWVCAIQVN